MAAILVGVLVPHPLLAGQRSADLAQASIEQLLQIDVTSVSKKEEQILRTPAAVYVITSDAIQRSGAVNIPEALRLAPGLHVAHINGNKWAITSRGFNGLWANKLLVLIDGRVVYSPVFSGVYWDLQELPLEDIDRIEVIRGPGAAIWGANAVNGVINIINKSARATQGGLVTVGGGLVNRGLVSARYGGALGANGRYRTYFRHVDYAAMADVDGSAFDQSHMTQAGFRADVDLNPIDSLSIEASGITGDSGERLPFPVTSYTEPADAGTYDLMSPARAGSALARWTRSTGAHSTFSLQGFWNRSYRLVIGQPERAQTFDVEFQHQFLAGNRHDFVWGAGQRFSSDDEGTTFAEYFEPSSGHRRVFNAFVQDEVSIVPNRLLMTVGTKVERSSLARMNVQPTARLMWLATPRQSLWASASRAVRTPSRVENAFHIDYAAVSNAEGLITVLGVRGNPDLTSEQSLTYETGYRAQASARVAVDAAVFYAAYSDLVTTTSVTSFDPAPAPHVFVLDQYGNGMSARTGGLELMTEWRPVDRWRLTGSYSWLRVDLRDVGTTLRASELTSRDPAHQWQVRTGWDLPRAWTIDGTLAFVGRLPSVQVPAYTRADVRLAGTVARGLTFALVGQNLLDAVHSEFGGFDGVTLTEPRRTGHATLTWRF